MRRLSYRDYSWPGTNWMSTVFTRQELGEPAKLAAVCDISAAAIQKGMVGSSTPLGLVFGWNILPWHIAVAFWQCLCKLHSSLKSAALHFPWGWEGKGQERKFGCMFFIFASWFLHVVFSVWHPSTRKLKTQSPAVTASCLDCQECVGWSYCAASEPSVPSDLP